MANENKSTVVRVLAALHLEGQVYQPNALVELPADTAAILKKSGSIDDSKAAIEYCKSLNTEIVEHVPVGAQSLADQSIAGV